MYSRIKEKISRSIPVSALLTLLSFVFILTLSWFYLSERDNSGKEEETHAFLQEQFQNLISEAVIQQAPEVEELIFHKVWTKNRKNPDEVKIFFSYSLLTKGQAGGESLLEGEALLKKSPEQAGLWIVRNFQITDIAVEFSEPLVIKARSTSPSAE